MDKRARVEQLPGLALTDWLARACALALCDGTQVRGARRPHHPHPHARGDGATVQRVVRRPGRGHHHGPRRPRAGGEVRRRAASARDGLRDAGTEQGEYSTDEDPATPSSLQGGSTGCTALAGMCPHAQPGCPHPRGATSCTRKAAPLTTADLRLSQKAWALTSLRSTLRWLEWTPPRNPHWPGQRRQCMYIRCSGRVRVC